MRLTVNSLFNDGFIHPQNIITLNIGLVAFSIIHKCSDEVWTCLSLASYVAEANLLTIASVVADSITITILMYGMHFVYIQRLYLGLYLQTININKQPQTSDKQNTTYRGSYTLNLCAIFTSCFLFTLLAHFFCVPSPCTCRFKLALFRIDS